MNCFVNAKRIVIKIGTTTLTHGGGLLNYRRMEHLIKTIADLKNTISDLKAQLAAAKAEIAKYKSVRGDLRTGQLEQENKDLRSKLRRYEEIIDRNSLWAYFSRHRGKTHMRDDAR